MDVGVLAATVPTKGIELTVVVPTFCERDNLPILVERLHDVLAETEWEVIFVDDDSPDGTGELARQIAQRDARVRLIQRIGRRGLSSACVEGVLSSSAPYFAVMDADLQHEERVLPDMLKLLKDQNLDVVVGSRYTRNGDASGLADRRREFISRVGGRVSRLILHEDLSDPMSGFFVMTRSAFDDSVRRLSQQGFKILLDVFASSPRPLRFVEVPYRFRERRLGVSKLDTMVAWEFGMLVLDKLIGSFVPVRFIVFAIVGGTGLLVHLGMLALLTAAGFVFVASQTIAVFAAMTWNFLLNNVITYRDKQLKGLALIKGLFTFYGICLVGAIANIGIATAVFDNQRIWWVAGLAGAIVGVVWNFAVSSILTWRQRIAD